MSKIPNGKPFANHERLSSTPTPSSNNKPSAANGYEEGESSTSGSQHSRGSFTPPTRAVDNVKFDSEGVDEWRREAFHGQDTQRRRSWKSGGFLLDSTKPAKGFHLFSKNHAPSNTNKGKNRVRSGDLLVTKRRPQTNGHQKTLSHGSSPLASHVTTPKYNDGSAEKHGDQSQSDSRRSFMAESSQSGTGTLQDDGGNGYQIPAQTFGFDTDPAQIVNMALSLNESRRRNFSGGRLVSGSSAPRRVLSGNHASAQDHDYRLTSTPTKPKTHTATKSSGDFHAKEPASAREEAPYNEIRDGTQGVFYDVSDATFNRVEKAKTHFELMYEFRKLLPHLPPLRAPGQGHNDSKISSRESREYNPLQYVRNRRIRFRERQPLHSEVEGWYDLQKVRSWVAAVIEGHNQQRNNPNECVRLPQLQDRPREIQSLNDADEPTTDSPASSIRRRNDNVPAKPRRPRQDLMFHPGDLLADAHWLEQGLNKTKIEDKDGNKLYPAHTSLKFDNWRNKTPLHEEELPKTSFDAQHSPVREAPAVPNLPDFRSSSGGRAQRVQQSRRRALRNSIVASHGSDSASRHRGGRFLKHRRQANGSSESSSGSDSGERRSRGRSKVSRHSSDHNTSRRSGSDRKMFDMLSAESERQDSSQSIRTGPKDTPLSAPEDRRDSRASNTGIAEQQPRTSYEDNTTGPSSPANDHFPSIAINLSPPGSRSPSPKKRPLHDRINPFSRDQNLSKRRVGIDSVDFAENAPQDGRSRTVSNEEKLPPLSDNASSRGTSPLSKRASLTPDEPIRSLELRRTQSTVSKSGSSARHDPSSRIRGIFRGGRIAELVGTEVSRVGEFIRKREIPMHTNLSSASSAASNISDTENEEPLRTPPPRRLRRFQTDSSATGLSPQQSRDEGPQYHMNNLPSFTSPFKRDREEQERLKAPSSSSPRDTDDDPISRQLREMRSRSRSPRFERLAPPRLEVSPTPSSPERYRSAPEDRDSYGFGKTIHLAGTTKASKYLNNTLDLKPGVRGPLVTGLASLDPTHSPSPTHGRPRLQATNSTSSALALSLSAQNPQTTHSEIARLRALLFSSGIKAREIYRRSHTVRDPPAAFLVSAFSPSPVPPVARREEHLYASRALVDALASSSASFRKDLSHFSYSIVPTLHARIQTLTDLVENKLNPRVSATGDEAGELLQKLTTTSTLAVKQLGDTVEAVRRRRRRRFRWVRQIGYVVIEWVVVGILWWVWLVVMIWKVVNGTVLVIGRGIKWAVWL